MPAATVTKQFGIGGSHLIGGSHKGPRKDANLYESLQAIFSDVINVRLMVSALIDANGGATSGLSLADQLLLVEN